MKKRSIPFRTQYNMVDADYVTGIDYTELVTVPDLVLSMEEIYLKYAVRGDISGLANNINPHVQDNFDLDDPALDMDIEEPVDILYESRKIRQNHVDKSADELAAQPAAEPAAQPAAEPAAQPAAEPRDFPKD